MLKDILGHEIEIGDIVVACVWKDNVSLHIIKEIITKTKDGNPRKGSRTKR